MINLSMGFFRNLLIFEYKSYITCTNDAPLLLFLVAYKMYTKPAEISDDGWIVEHIIVFINFAILNDF